MARDQEEVGNLTIKKSKVGFSRYLTALLFSKSDLLGLNKLKETYLGQLQELYRSKPQDKGDEALLESLSRLDAESDIAKDDLVSYKWYFFHEWMNLLVCCVACYSSPSSWPP